MNTLVSVYMVVNFFFLSNLWNFIWHWHYVGIIHGESGQMANVIDPKKHKDLLLCLAIFSCSNLNRTIKSFLIQNREIFNRLTISCHSFSSTFFVEGCQNPRNGHDCSFLTYTNSSIVYCWARRVFFCFRVFSTVVHGGYHGPVPPPT